MLIPKGTTGNRPTGVSGYLRFNTTSNEFEGYNGTAWASVGGAALSNDTSTSSNIYPLSAAATSGTAPYRYQAPVFAQPLVPGLLRVWSQDFRSRRTAMAVL